MSVLRTDRVDAVAVRDGWAVVTVYQLEEWEPVEDLVEAFRAKLSTCLAHVAGAGFQQTFHRTPVRIELVSRDPVPDEIAELCRLNGVVIA